MLTAYQRYADDLCKGCSEAEKPLQEERIFSSCDLPYSTQLIPLAAICTALMDGNRFFKKFGWITKETVIQPILMNICLAILQKCAF